MMREVQSWSICLVAGLLLLGCKPSTADKNSGSSTTPRSNDLVLGQMHWIGKQQVWAATNTWKLKQIWAQPESLLLETQILARLVTTLTAIPATQGGGASAAVATLRPMLEDLLQTESYWELWGVSNKPTTLALAIHLPAERTAFWRLHLTNLLDSLSAGSASPPRVQWDHLEPWTILTLTRSDHPASSPGLPAHFRNKLASTTRPVTDSATNYFLELQLEAGWLQERWGIPALPPLESLHFGMFGAGETVKTRGAATFARPLELPLEAWNIPSNSIGQPLLSFSAGRGFGPYLAAASFWRQRRLGAAPNQIFFWSLDSAPWLHFFSTQSSNAEPQFLALKDFLLEEVNPELMSNRLGSFQWVTNADQVTWRGVPFCNPTVTRSGAMLQGGFVAPTPPHRTLPVEFIQKLTTATNLVYYDWESSGPQVANWLQIAQLMRLAFSRAQLAHTNAAALWLQMLHTNLAFCATSISLESPRTLAFARSSTIGFSSTELQVLADWFDSPSFPRGLYTFVTPRKTLSRRPARASQPSPARPQSRPSASPK